ncbi:MAG: hypothetical protein QXH24_04895 [Candidatus Bathyarchaeia archaeon]
MLKGYYTSTIGSFPLTDTEDNRRRCLKDLIALRIDYPAYPQLTDMGKQFLDDLASQNSGISFYQGEYKITKKEINVDVKPPGLEPFLWTVNYIEKRGLGVKIKAPVTGPFTLASYIMVSDRRSLADRAIGDINLIEQIAQIISKTCNIISKKAEMISIDEPILSIIVGLRVIFKYSENEIKKVLDFIRNNCGNTLTGIHVCGRISPKLANILLGTELDFLSHEFYDTPANMRVYSPNDIKKSGKILSVGCLSTRKPNVESVEEIAEFMRKFKGFGDCLIFTPDCGFRNLIIDNSSEKGYYVAMKKLRNMVKAAIKLKEGV